MVHLSSPVASINRVGPGIYVMGFLAGEIAAVALPGQFINIRVVDSCQPLLRRPFSIYRVAGDTIEIIFNVVGAGTNILSTKKAGDMVDIIGPLGRSFDTDGDYKTALLIGGGMGVAPLPILTLAVKPRRKFHTFLGARSKELLISTHLENVLLATDDGSAGFHGTVVGLVREKLVTERYTDPKIFACGPNPMLNGISQMASEYDIPCELSLESVMACGIGICQGCPVENTGSEKKYSLICKDGPVFNSKSIVLS
jgi:dihydroorotate dehydrogenase electron transfer subunit